MKIGMLNISSNRAGDPPSRALHDWIDVGVEAERRGFWSCWTTEHHFASDRSYQPFGLSDEEFPPTDYDMAADPFTLLTYLAARTSRLRLGTAVSVLHWDHPIRVVERAALLDALSGGRLEFGVGRGVGFRETVVFGVPTEPAANGRRYQEAIEIIRRAWSGEPFSFEGEFYKIPPVSLTPQPERQPAPLWVGSASNDSAAWAARNNLPYATITWPLTGMDRYKEKRAVYLEAAEEAGVDVSSNSIPHFLYTYCAETDEQAAAVGYEYMTRFQYILESHYEHRRDHPENAVTSSGERYRGENAVHELAQYPVDHHIIGSPETCIERIREYEREVGLNYLVCNVGFGRMPKAMTIASLRLLGEKVLPHFADAPVVSSA